MKSSEYKRLGKNFLKDGFELFKKSDYGKVLDKLIDQRKIKNIDFKSNLILIGVATELILKAAYIRKGYLIYKTKTPIRINKFKDSWNFKKTLDFYELIENCDLIFNKNIKPEELKKRKTILHRIRMWRNDESHGYTNNEPKIRAE